jgi:RimJ/RimL family protein N-acetyltransferase
MNLPHQLVGDRVVLRPWRESDAEAFYDLVIRSREHIRQWLAWPDEYQSIDDARAFLRRKAAAWLRHEDFGMGLFDRSGTLLGSVALHPVNWQVPSLGIGYWIGAPYDGQGYVTEAVRLVVTFSLDALGANRLSITCDVDNRRSASVALRCGFTLEGILRSDGRKTDGRLRDTMVFSLLPSDRR